MLRDFQRKKVYTWEAAYIQLHQNNSWHSTLAEVEAVIAPAITTANIRMPNVIIFDKSYSDYDPVLHEIRISRAALDTMTILHEAAHAIQHHHPTLPKYPYHGFEFVAVVGALYHKHIGIEVPELLDTITASRVGVDQTLLQQLALQY